MVRSPLIGLRAAAALGALMAVGAVSVEDNRPRREPQPPRRPEPLGVDPSSSPDRVANGSEVAMRLRLAAQKRARQAARQSKGMKP